MDLLGMRYETNQWLGLGILLIKPNSEKQDMLLTAW